MSLCQQPANCRPLSISSSKAQSENHGIGQALSPEVTVSIAFGIIMFLLAAYGIWQGRQRFKWKSDEESFSSEWPRSSKRSHPELELGFEGYHILYPRLIPAATIILPSVHIPTAPRAIPPGPGCTSLHSVENALGNEEKKGVYERAVQNGI